MEGLLLFVLIIVGYSLITGVSSLFFVRALYKQYLKQNKLPISKVSMTGRKLRPEEIEKFEIIRRGNLAEEALKVGIISGLAWFASIPLVMGGWCLIAILNLYQKLAIDPEDKEFVTAIEYRKAEEIVAKWNMQESDQFEKELNA